MKALLKSQCQQLLKVQHQWQQQDSMLRQQHRQESALRSNRSLQAFPIIPLISVQNIVCHDQVVWLFLKVCQILQLLDSKPLELITLFFQSQQMC
jgi:hypothetical protein